MASDRSPLERFAQERPALSPLPPEPFEVSRFVPVSISSKATVQIEGATYSVPSTWARLDATAYVGVSDVRLICRGEVRTYQKAKRGQRVIRYRDYLPELAHKPQAGRLVAPELLKEPGEPWVGLWDLLVSTRGAREDGRVLSRLLAAVVAHGEQRVGADLQKALSKDGANLLALRVWLDGAEEVRSIAVPDQLSGYEIESARAGDYDWLLVEGGER